MGGGGSGSPGQFVFQLSLLLAGVGEVDESLGVFADACSISIRAHTGAAANFCLYITTRAVPRRNLERAFFVIGMRFTQPPMSCRRSANAAEKIRVGLIWEAISTHTRLENHSADSAIP